MKGVFTEEQSKRGFLEGGFGKMCDFLGRGSLRAKCH